MPKTVTFTRQPPEPVQQRLPRRRRNIRRRSSPPAPSNKQSTLTQIDFVSTPLQRRNLIPQSSEEEEFEDPRPTKRQKRNGSDGRQKVAGRSESQSTLTQKWDQPISSGKVIGDTDDDAATESDRDEDEQHGPESGIPFLRANDDTGEDQPNPATVMMKAHPSTPRRPRKEVPSSETPSSIKLSLSVSPSIRKTFDRSPLRERSINHVLQENLEFSRSSVILRQRQSQRSNRQQLSSESKMAGPIDSSQNVSSSPLLKAPAKDEVATLKRTSTVQDSQCDAEDLSEAELSYDRSNDEHFSTDEDETQSVGEHQQTQYQLTYDPVVAALDRDAARFAQRTQPSHIGYEIDAVNRDMEESEQQLLRELNAPFGNELEYANDAFSSQLPGPTIPSSPENQQSITRSSPPAKERNIAQICDSVNTKGIISIPDSPVFVALTPLPRSSQSSPVASSTTQMTMQAQYVPEYKRDALPDDPSSMIWQDTLSSSAYRRLSSTAEEREPRGARTANGEGLLSDITDFSLPQSSQLELAERRYRPDCA